MADGLTSGSAGRDDPLDQSLRPSGFADFVGQAEARANEDISSWVRKMEESGKFTDIELGGVTSQGGTRNFSMTGVYNPKL